MPIGAKRGRAYPNSCFHGIWKASILDAKRLIEQGPTLTTKGASPEDECLCVVKCLQRYKAVTAEFQPREEALFLSYARPHKPVTAQRLAHWVKDLLGEAGVDTSEYKAHSVCGVSTSAAIVQRGFSRRH